MPDYQATIGVTADAFLSIHFSANDETAAIDQAISCARRHHDTRTLTIVDQSERGWRIDDLVLLDAKGLADWDNGIVCEDVPLDRQAYALRIAEAAPVLLALFRDILVDLDHHAAFFGQSWWQASEESTVAEIVRLFSRVGDEPQLTPAGVSGLIQRMLRRLDNPTEATRGDLVQTA